MYLKVVLVLLVLGQVQGVEVVRYDNYSVYKVDIANQGQYDSFQLQANKLNLVTWHFSRYPNEYVDVMVAPADRPIFDGYLKDHNFTYSLKMENVQEVIDAQRPKRRLGGMEWTQYHSLNEIYAWLDHIESKYTDIVTPFNIGNSYEGRPIRGIKISHKEGNNAVFIEANIHGNEWIGSATATYFIDELLAGRKPGVRDLAQNIDWYIIPVLNPDGFVYSHEVDRTWRKSRFPSDPTGECIGTDLNRNFNFKWNEAGASDDPCSTRYGGPNALSDVEIQHLTNYINTQIPDGHIKIYISLHSYGQLVLTPWGHTADEFPPHYELMLAVGNGFADALARRYGTKFHCGSSATTLYQVSGAGKEWAYGTKNITIPYTIELRDTGDYGFLLPPEQIIPVGQEVTDGFVGMIYTARNLGVL